MRQLFALFAVLVAAPAFAQGAGQGSEQATADLIGLDGKDIGRATLTNGSDGVLIEIEAANLPKGRYLAFHVHENGSCDAAGGFASAGGHFNPDRREHGFLAAEGIHAGDMPNLWSDEAGRLRGQVFNAAVTLDGEKGIRGRALVLHERSDDNRSQPSGDAGNRLACGEIR